MKNTAQEERPKPDGEATVRKSLLNQGSLYAWPMGIWLIIFFVAPLIIILVYSFLKKDAYGAVLPQFSLKASFHQPSRLHSRVAGATPLHGAGIRRFFCFL